MAFTRTLTTRRVSNVVDVKETVRNLSRRDLPFTMSQHVTLGPPFLEKGVTVFDMPAIRCQTFPGKFGAVQRLRQNAPFEWPTGPGTDGRRVDMRMIGREHKKSSDFTANLIDTRRTQGWFTALNPDQGVLLAYVWDRADFPWVGNWEENYCRKGNPWAGKSLTRGMEFTNTPFPEGLRKAVDMGRFHGIPTFRWLPAGGTVEYSYSLLFVSVPPDVRGVADLESKPGGFTLDLIRGE